MRTLSFQTQAASSLVRHSGKQADEPPQLGFARPSALVDEAHDLSTLIGDVYDAAINPARWSSALDRAARFVGGKAAALYSKDAAHRSGAFYYDNGCIDPESRRLYSERYVQLDPTTTGHVFAEIDEPLTTADLIPYREYVETRFYREWARPQGFAFGISAVLDKGATSATLFGVFHEEHDAAADQETRRRMRLIVPHIRRATLVGRAIDLSRSEAATLADTFDDISAGVLLVDGSGRILHVNLSGQKLVDGGDVLRLVDDRIAAHDPLATRQLRESFAAAALSDAAIGAKGLSVSLAARCGRRHVAHVLPLFGGERRRAGANYAAACALFVREASLDVTSGPEVIASTYQLTPTELRVLIVIVEVGGVPEVAEALGVAESTVKTHLGRLFGKTGTFGQADLVKIVAGFSSPLLN